MNILITGASGYIGNALKNYLKKEHLVRTFSFSNDSFDELNLQNINCIFHLSALVHQKKVFSLEKYLHVNCQQTIKLAKKAKQSGVKKFVFISSVSVYGDEVEKIDEITPCNPKSFYGISKLQAEDKLKKLNSDDFVIQIIRIPMVYGKNAPGNIAKLINIIRKFPILPFAKINNERNFIFIKNLLYGLDKILYLEEQGLFLLCDDEALSTSEFIKLIANALDKKIILFKIPFFEILIKLIKPTFHKKLFGSLHVNNVQTKQKLNFKNPYTPREGIRQMLS